MGAMRCSPTDPSGPSAPASNATPAQAAEVHGYLRGLVSQLGSKDLAQTVRILYGGSVKPDNAARWPQEPRRRRRPGGRCQPAGSRACIAIAKKSAAKGGGRIKVDVAMFSPHRHPSTCSSAHHHHRARVCCKPARAPTSASAFGGGGKSGRVRIHGTPTVLGKLTAARGRRLHADRRSRSPCSARKRSTTIDAGHRARARRRRPQRFRLSAAPPGGATARRPAALRSRRRARSSMPPARPRRRCRLRARRHLCSPHGLQPRRRRRRRGCPGHGCSRLPGTPSSRPRSVTSSGLIPSLTSGRVVPRGRAG